MWYYTLMFFRNHTARVFWRFIRPEIEELTVYVITFLTLASIAAYQAITSDIEATASDFSTTFSIIGEKIAFITDGGTEAAQFFTFGLWFIIGTFVYALAFFVINAASGAFRDIAVSSNYVHPSTFHKSDFWFSIVARTLIRVTAAISLLFYSGMWLVSVAPGCINTMRSAINNGLSVSTVTSFMVAALSIVVSVHIAAILLRLILLRSGYSYER